MHCSRCMSLLCFCIAGCMLAGCSISYSSGKSSDSISGSFDSISGSFDSSSGGTTAAPAATAYAEDVAAATVLYTASPDNTGYFQQIISTIARSHGIVDWEQEKITYTAMGKGLKQAGISESQIAELPYFHGLGHKSAFKGVLSGYRS